MNKLQGINKQKTSNLLFKVTSFFKIPRKCLEKADVQKEVDGFPSVALAIFLSTPRKQNGEY